MTSDAASSSSSSSLEAGPAAATGKAAPKGLGAGLGPKRKPAAAPAATAKPKGPTRPEGVPPLPVPPRPGDSEDGQEEVIEIDATSAQRPRLGGGGAFGLDLLEDAGFGDGPTDDDGWESASNESAEMRALFEALSKGHGGGPCDEEDAIDGAAGWVGLFDRGTLLACGAVLGVCTATLAVLALRSAVWRG